MSKPVWNVGDACFIVDLHTDPRCISVKILRATVTQVFNTEGTHARALSLNRNLLGRPETVGQPFASVKAARQFLRTYAKQVRRAASRAEVSGEGPAWQLPQDAPKQGDTVYTLDVEQKELLQVTVGIVRVDNGQMEVAYDQSPGNPEASNVRMRRWWTTWEAAEIYVHQNHGEGWTFVSKEELARRINGDIDQIFTKAQARLRDPLWLA